MYVLSMSVKSILYFPLKCSEVEIPSNENISCVPRVDLHPYIQV